MTDQPESRAVACEVLDPPPGRLSESQARAIRLDTPDAIRLELARVYRSARCGALPVADACKLGYLLGELRKAIEVDLIDRRLKALEDHHAIR